MSTNRSRMIGVVGLLFFSLNQTTAGANPNGKFALIYQGPGACIDGCSEAAAEMAKLAGLVPVMVGPTALNSNSTPEMVSNFFQDVAVWIQPGGKSRHVVSAMTPTLTRELKNFVARGGGYVGFCAGAFSATRRVGTTRYFGFHIFPGRTVLYPNARGAEMVTLNWEGQNRKIYWEGGPYLTELPEGNGAESVEITARYENGWAASARSQYGNGRVYLTGLHPEAPQSWRDDYGMVDPDGLDYDLAVGMIDWVRFGLQLNRSSVKRSDGFIGTPVADSL